MMLKRSHVIELMRDENHVVQKVSSHQTCWSPENNSVALIPLGSWILNILIDACRCIFMGSWVSLTRIM